MEIIFKDEQIAQISSKLNVPKNAIYNIISGYVNYLKQDLSEGRTIKFLNICYLKVSGKDEDVHKTLAYIAHEVGNSVGQSPIVTYRVLETYEEFIVKELSKLNSFSIRGLVRIRLERYGNEYKVRIKKSTVYNGQDVYVTTLPSFKRKLEVV